jgi:hypothetical protein
MTEPTKNAELPDLLIKNGGLYKTKNGSVIEASGCIYMPNYKGPIHLQFSLAYESADNVEKDLLGYVILYDENLCHKQGNHVDRDEGLDIIERFEGQLPERCPNCRHCLGKISYTRAPAEKGDGLPDGWELVTNETCFQLQCNGLIIAVLAGPDSEQNAALLAQALSRKPDVEAMQKYMAELITTVAMPHITPERKAEWDANQKRHQEIADFIKSRIFADLLEDALRSTGLISGGVSCTEKPENVCASTEHAQENPISCEAEPKDVDFSIYKVENTEDPRNRGPYLYSEGWNAAVNHIDKTEAAKRELARGVATASPQPEPEWRDISTAPTTVPYLAEIEPFTARQGDRVFPCYGEKPTHGRAVFYDLTDFHAGDGYSVYHHECQPTHWQPQPAPARQLSEDTADNAGQKDSAE